MPIDQHATAHAVTRAPQADATPVSAPTPTNPEKTSETRDPNRGIAFSCSGCESRWTGTSRAHCAAPGCHRTFSTPNLFDLHRSARGDRGTCLDPATVRNRHGERLLFFRDGLWRGPEMTDVERARTTA